MDKDDVLVALSLQFEPRDLWVGCYWTTGWTALDPSALRVGRALQAGGLLPVRTLTLYLCLLPMFPLVVTLAWLGAER